MTHSRTTRRSKVLFGAIAAAALSLAVTDSAQAGAKEAKALSAQLGGNTSGATADELAAAVKAVIGANPKMKPGVVAGEALKLAAAITNTAGAAIAQALIEAAPSGDRAVIAGDAAKTAGLGKGNDVAQVDEFASVYISGLTANGQAIAAAERAKASKAGAAALIQGVGANYSQDDKEALVKQALGSKKLAGAATEIAAASSGGVADPRAFALEVVSGASALAHKIAPGVVASNPKSAATILEGLYGTNNTVLVKQVSAVAKTVAAVADIEEISNVALVLGRQIGGGSIKTSKAAALAKTLTAAIVAKANDTIVGSGNTVANKADEVAEVAAFIVAGLTSNSTLNTKTAPKLIAAIIKSAIAGGKANVKKGQSALPTSYVQDIVGSVAITIANSSLNSDVQNAIQALLLKQAKKLGGKPNEQFVKDGLEQGFAKNERYEDGAKYNAEQPTTGFVVDPETDDRGF